MIPTHMFHELKRARTGAEQREAGLRKSESAAAIAQVGSLFTRPIRASLRFAQQLPARLATEQTVSPPGGGQLPDESGLPAAD
ncbi:MAG: hypothetical protein ABSA65_02380 [Acidimicrobiales bacterium]|jgi:hypothetical protein